MMLHTNHRAQLVCICTYSLPQFYHHLFKGNVVLEVGVAPPATIVLLCERDVRLFLQQKRQEECTVELRTCFLLFPSPRR